MLCDYFSVDDGSVIVVRCLLADYFRSEFYLLWSSLSLSTSPVMVPECSMCVRYLMVWVFPRKFGYFDGRGKFTWCPRQRNLYGISLLLNSHSVSIIQAHFVHNYDLWKPYIEPIYVEYQLIFVGCVKRMCIYLVFGVQYKYLAIVDSMTHRSLRIIQLRKRCDVICSENLHGVQMFSVPSKLIHCNTITPNDIKHNQLHNGEVSLWGFAPPGSAVYLLLINSIKHIQPLVSRCNNMWMWWTVVNV